MRSTSTLRLIAALVLGPFLLLWFLSVVAYATDPTYYEHIESSLVVVDQQWMHGRPLYHPTDYPYVYSFLYGPFCYVWMALVLQLGFDPISASKLSGGFWGLSGVILLFLALQKRWNGLTAVAGTGLLAAELLSLNLDPGVVAGDRSDPMLVAMTSLGLLGLVGRPAMGAGLITIALAIAIDCKVHALVYFVPILAVWTFRHGLVSCLLLVVSSVVLSLLVFLLPNISLINYLAWLQMAGHHPLVMSVFEDNVRHFFLFLVPLLLFVCLKPLPLSWKKLDEDTILFWTLLAAGLAACIPASKIGAGPHHLMPLLPYAGYLLCAGLHAIPQKFAYTWVTACGLILIFCLYLYPKDMAIDYYVYSQIKQANAPAVQADLNRLLSKYPPEQTQMGVGGDASYPITFYAPLLYRSGQPCVLNSGSFMDMKEAGFGDGALTNSLAMEQYRYWLIPKSDLPFTLNSYYTLKPLFDAAVAETFAQHYAKIDSSGYYDIYAAKGAAR